MAKRLTAGILCLCTAGVLHAVTFSEVLLKLESAPVTVYFHEQNRTIAERVLESAGTSVTATAALLGLDRVHPLSVIIVRSDEEFRRLTGGYIPEWGAGAALPLQAVVCLKSGSTAGPAETDRIVRHEVAHILLAQALNGGAAPRWFDEGFAEMMTPDGVQDLMMRLQSFSTGSTIDLEDVDNILTFQRDKAGLAYVQSRAAVEYMQERFGVGAVRDIAGLIASGSDFTAAFSAVTGAAVETFQSEWLAAMKSRYRWGIFVQMPALLALLMAGGFTAAYIAARGRAARKKREWDEEESDET
ncbi:hypothetical protein JXO52_15725 [bacterium]|nr:hypothetical protein [bacterium]